MAFCAFRFQLATACDSQCSSCRSPGRWSARRALELVLDWAELHQGELLKDWDSCQQHEQPADIAPLQ
ncbi:MAG: hypothetical protein V5B60_14650 [Accumulibacter sp.]|uniref:hypothetical protein n=1 Tax=Accumulibacter sp. TaxID=2053492 RepID=UPI002FC353C6